MKKLILPLGILLTAALVAGYARNRQLARRALEEIFKDAYSWDEELWSRVYTAFSDDELSEHVAVEHSGYVICNCPACLSRRESEFAHD
jgi:hypothetical protein